MAALADHLLLGHSKTHHSPCFSDLRFDVLIYGDVNHTRVVVAIKDFYCDWLRYPHQSPPAHAIARKSHLLQYLTSLILRILSLIDPVSLSYAFRL
ncbi:hypothetical protein VI06_21365 [Aquitalea magnusonii]|nr:hypothetical protein VI06_21365 [Aquitalea magnusonii]